MKTISLPVVRSLRLHLTNPFTWLTCQRVLNAIPFGLTPCKTVIEAKFYTLVFATVIGALFFWPLLIVGVLIFSSIQK